MTIVLAQGARRTQEIRTHGGKPGMRQSALSVPVRRGIWMTWTGSGQFPMLLAAIQPTCYGGVAEVPCGAWRSFAQFAQEVSTWELLTLGIGQAPGAHLNRETFALGVARHQESFSGEPLTSGYQSFGPR